MQILRIAAIAAVISSLGSGAVRAYELNPLKNKYHGGRPEGGFWERISETVHEDITDAAVWCMAGRETAMPSAPCSLDAPGRTADTKGNKWNALIRGVWWNDDPNQHLFGVHYATWAIWMRDAQGIAKTHRDWLGRTKALNATYKMQYRSHYGDLQFLHAMANADGEAAAEVRRRAINWIGFAYAVAIGNIEAETKLGDIDDPVMTEYFTKQSGWTVNHLFAPKFTLGRSTIPDVALGSILHVVQDSFSDSHATRDYGSSPVCPHGRILEFHAYGSQDSGRHGAADTRSAWRTNSNFTLKMNPVEASARILQFAKARAEWHTAVRPYLESELFCLDLDSRPSGAGEYAS
ncbi:hypothetical protein SLG_26680 [Sphingobium sp. SYK-6]|uniref:hypothetical protein n=1 Tax=Sphingobium sp. (strain NBRC 103272 / SYK-6) TaxID=627192 RepID=UPI0002276F29|nr:hypothetical protein [Sphingobium sp. SYK-6]BAK67343.1 hypothetical protein SLG_26680 [Sphingobium sp. SYK-6]